MPHPELDVLYAVSEVGHFDGEPGGGVIALRLDRTSGRLDVIDRVSSHGIAPCHVSVDSDGRHLYVANYVSGSVASYELDPRGQFGPLVAARVHEGSGPTDRQEGPHAHCIVPGPVGGLVHAVDLGIDAIVHYRPDARGGSTVFEEVGSCLLPAGSGPRHLAFHPHRPVAFVVGELDSTVSVLDVDPDTGELDHVATTSTLPPGWLGESSTAEVVVHPSGQYVYVSNRGHDSIAIFDFNAAGPALNPAGHVDAGGRDPRHFAIDPTGETMLVAAQHGNRLTSFRLDPSTGGLERLGSVEEVTEPVCVRFL